jgi:YegS/Rv2252/BmrU family lipid kinase
MLAERKQRHVSARLISAAGNHLVVRTCIIFNPTARGDKARHFREWLEGVATECTLKPTRCAGDARRLATEAVAEHFDLVVAAGGDGTVNEVINGLGDAPEGFARAALGVLPLGTVNVFARELKLPWQLPEAWRVLQRGQEQRIDLPRVEFSAQGKTERRYFGQMAGAGLDARAIELVSWSLKKKIGPLAYIVAGCRALLERKPQIRVCTATEELSGELILLGNGKLYGGRFEIFSAANLQDGLLDVCVFPRANLGTLLRCAPGLLWQKKLPEKSVRRVSAATIKLSSTAPAAFELDGEWVGQLPATFSIESQKLRVIVP